MSFQKHTWVKNELIRAKELNRIEDGIYNEEQRALNVEESLGIAIEDEAARAQTEETSLSSRITANTQGITLLNASSSTPGSVDYKIEQAISGGGGSSGVTGVKGSEEEEYRDGNVELSADDVGAVSYNSNQGLSAAQQAAARTNIGAGTSDFDGQYSSLTGQPTIPGGVKVGTTRAAATDTTLYFVYS